MNDPRRYMRMMDFIRGRIEDGTYKPNELIPPIQEMAEQTGHSRHTISKALRLLQDQGLVERTPGLGYVARTTTVGGHLRPLTAVNGHTSVQGGGAHADR
jgi:DNA-binding GntR family transcriptional regulator